MKNDPGNEDEVEEAEEVEGWGEEDDDTDALNDIQYSLFEFLDNINEARTWASYVPILSNPPIPGLHLSQGGVVGLPLSLTDATRLKQHASPIESGKNHSVYDDDVTCDFDPSQFELRNPMWHAFAEYVGKEAVKPFGVDQSTIQLRRLTLSGPSRPLNHWQEYVRSLIYYNLG